ncbi:hypothetical protein SKAU_G00311190 [Synaphobranchus kaupii]|uniref:Uncharacterized protein n=1 Tax=Synaphobranchus kaupii TaxID=118154 RepID=A0A9Q1ERP8_SYNKA|nr:hypothetical protein SKAU_G00311190 [Synaphobranchus kaupii]
MAAKQAELGEEHSPGIRTHTLYGKGAHREAKGNRSSRLFPGVASLEAAGTEGGVGWGGRAIWIWPGEPKAGVTWHGDGPDYLGAESKPPRQSPRSSALMRLGGGSRRCTAHLTRARHIIYNSP